MRDFDTYNVVSNLILIGFNEPQTYFNTVSNGLEKYNPLQLVNSATGNDNDLESEAIRRGKSIIKWLGIST